MATSIVLLLLSSNAQRSLLSNYLACWSTELGQWGWPHAALAPSSNINNLFKSPEVLYYDGQNHYFDVIIPEKYELADAILPV